MLSEFHTCLPKDEVWQDEHHAEEKNWFGEGLMPVYPTHIVPPLKILFEEVTEEVSGPGLSYTQIVVALGL